MKRILSLWLFAGTMAVAACNEHDGVGRPLGLAAAADSSGDSIPPPKPGPVVSVTVNPESVTVGVGDSAGFFADLRDANGNPAKDANVKWSVADPSVARIEGEFGQSVILRALRLGTTTVTARSHGKSGTALLLVDSLPPPPPPPPGDSVATVTVSPDSAVAAVGDTIAYFATLRDAQGNILSGRVVTWSVGDSTVARVEAASGESAVIRALAAGSTRVTATSEGKSGSGSLLVR
jgi:uncharacterized protein YjdB